MFRTLAGTLLLFALSTPAAAEVVDAQANGLGPLAPLVDQVVALSLTRFTTFVETGRPE